MKRPLLQSIHSYFVSNRFIRNCHFKFLLVLLSNLVQHLSLNWSSILVIKASHATYATSLLSYSATTVVIAGHGSFLHGAKFHLHFVFLFARGCNNEEDFISSLITEQHCNPYAPPLILRIRTLWTKLKNISLSVGLYTFLLFTLDITWNRG